MTKQDKADLRWSLRNQPHLTDEYLAVMSDCTIRTVRKYRKVLCK